MESTVDGNLPINLNSNARSGLSRYRISLKFINTPNANTRLDVFDGIKKFGIFNIQNMSNHVYTLDFKSELTKGAMDERLKELTGPGKQFDYTIEDVD